MYAPHSVTVYNITTSELPETGFKPKEAVHITILRGVMMQESKAENVRATGLEGADAVNLYIPFDVQATDGITGEPKKYVGPQEFWKAPDKSRIWTLSVNGDGGDSIFVKGEVVEKTADLALAHDSSYTITKVDMMDYGSADMQHWEVGGH